MSINPSHDPAMSHAAGQDEAAEGMNEQYSRAATEDDAAESAQRHDEKTASSADVPDNAAGAGAGDSSTQGEELPGTASGSDVSHPLG